MHQALYVWCLGPYNSPLGEHYYYPQFTGEETELREVTRFAKVTQLVNGRVWGTGSQA